MKSCQTTCVLCSFYVHVKSSIQLLKTGIFFSGTVVENEDGRKPFERSGPVWNPTVRQAAYPAGVSLRVACDPILTHTRVLQRVIRRE